MTSSSPMTTTTTLTVLWPVGFAAGKKYNLPLCLREKLYAENSVSCSQVFILPKIDKAEKVNNVDPEKKKALPGDESSSDEEEDGKDSSREEEEEEALQRAREEEKPGLTLVDVIKVTAKKKNRHWRRQTFY